MGKLESAADGRCTVSIFHSILKSEVVELSLEEISRAYLSPQTRVYVRDGERFQVGQVTNYLTNSNGLIDYEIRFPNNQQRDVSELDLFMRLRGTLRRTQPRFSPGAGRRVSISMIADRRLWCRCWRFGAPHRV